MKDVYGQLLELFYGYRPNDETYLGEYPELVEQMEALEKMPTDTEEELLKAIRALTYFNESWFPDSVEQEEQERVRGILSKAYAVIAQHS